MSDAEVAMYRHVIFDLDGTLLNTIDDLANAGNYVCKLHNWPTHSVEQYKYFIGNGIQKLVERFFPEELRDQSYIKYVMDNEFTPYYNAHKEDKTAPYPGLPKLVENLKKHGVVMAVLTNKAHSLARPVVEHYYPGVFSYVQGALPDYPTKPDPTLLHRLMSEIGADRKSTLFVGDSNVDIRTAKNGGLVSCGVLWGFRTRRELEEEGADFITEDPEQLEKLILHRG